MRSTFAVLAVMFGSVAALVVAQGGPEFEVTSVKQNQSGGAGAGFDMSRGQIRATNVPLRVIIRQAFDLMDSQIVGAPSWASSERYDVLAKAPAGATTADAMRPQLRDLLIKRFQLKTHTEKREMPVYVLVRTRADGQFGPSLRQAPVDCAANESAGSKPDATSSKEWPICSVSFTAGALYVGGYRLTEVARLLAPLVGRTITDATGITGPVQVRLEYRAQAGAAQAPSSVNDDRPDLFTALQEQAGLKLEDRRASVDVLVIDALERPSPD